MPPGSSYERVSSAACTWNIIAESTSPLRSWVVSHEGTASYPGSGRGHITPHTTLKKQLPFTRAGDTGNSVNAQATKRAVDPTGFQFEQGLIVLRPVFDVWTGCFKLKIRFISLMGFFSPVIKLWRGKWKIKWMRYEHPRSSFHICLVCFYWGGTPHLHRAFWSRLAGIWFEGVRLPISPPSCHLFLLMGACSQITNGCI